MAVVGATEAVTAADGDKAIPEAGAIMTANTVVEEEEEEVAAEAQAVVVSMDIRIRLLIPIPFEDKSLKISDDSFPTIRQL